MTQETIYTDVLVVGGGSAGVAAAVGAARAGHTVVLVEKYGFPGGMATAAQVGTVCGAYFRSANGARFIDCEFVAEFCVELARRSGSVPVTFAEHLWFLPYEVFQFKRLCDELLVQSGCRIYLHSTVCGVEKESRKISMVTVLMNGALRQIKPHVVIDCSGAALLSSLAGDEILKPDDECTPFQAGAAVFDLAGISEEHARSLGFLLIKEVTLAVTSGALPQDCARVSLVPGSFTGGVGTFKLALPELMVHDTDSLTRGELQARSKIETLLDYLRAKVPAFEGARLMNVAPQVGVRTGPRPAGKAILSENDVLSARKSGSSAAQGVWPVEEWGTDKGPRLTYFGLDEYYDIPVESLISKDTDNLLFAGRNISAGERAIASARVIGTCLSTGFFAGRNALEITGDRETENLHR